MHCYGEQDETTQAHPQYSFPANLSVALRLEIWTELEDNLSPSPLRMKMRYLYYLSSGSYNEISLTRRLQHLKYKSTVLETSLRAGKVLANSGLQGEFLVFSHDCENSGLFFFLKGALTPTMVATPFRKC